MEQDNRERVIVRTSVIGIAANVLLVVAKAIIGLLANSIAVLLDAVNNLSDALSSVITIVGTKLSVKKPDKKHPLGYGRIEYLSAMIVAALVLYAGITSLVESVKKIIHPEEADYSTVSLVIIALAVAVKLLLGLYVRKKGRSVNSGSLVASGSDALFDAVLSGSVLLSAIVLTVWGISLEAYVGVIISGFIVKSGVEMLMETLDEILGKRVEKDYSDELKKTICEDPCVSGAYDLILHNYGPDRYVGSVHVEVPDTMTAEQIDSMERRIAQSVYEKYGVILAGISIYSQNTTDEGVKDIRTTVTELVNAHEGVLQIHGFFADTERKLISLDVILDFALPDRSAAFESIKSDICKAYPDYTVNMTMDLDV